MHRCLAAVVGVCVLAFAGGASSLHVHAYLDHKHDHSHAPASHAHPHVAAAEEHHDTPHVSACDPAAHLIRVAYAASVGAHVVPVAADIVLTDGVVRPPASVRRVLPLDIREHGPPPSPCRRLRAPPLQAFL